MKVVIILFDEYKQNVVMFHGEDGQLQYIEGDVETNESPVKAAYRVLNERMKIPEEVVSLDFVRQEIVTSKVRGVWNYYTTVGILPESYKLDLPQYYSWISTKNRLVFLDISKTCSYYELIKESITLLENKEEEN